MLWRRFMCLSLCWLSTCWGSAVDQQQLLLLPCFRCPSSLHCVPVTFLPIRSNYELLKRRHRCTIDMSDTKDAGHSCPGIISPPLKAVSAFCWGESWAAAGAAPNPALLIAHLTSYIYPVSLRACQASPHLHCTFTVEEAKTLSTQSFPSCHFSCCTCSEAAQGF